MKKSGYSTTDLICLDCGYVCIIARKIYRLKNDDHIKDLYCPICMEDRKFLELKDASVFWHKYKEEEKISDIKKRAIELLNKRYESDNYGEDRVPKKILKR